MHIGIGLLNKIVDLIKQQASYPILKKIIISTAIIYTVIDFNFVDLTPSDNMSEICTSIVKDIIVDDLDTIYNIFPKDKAYIHVDIYAMDDKKIKDMQKTQTCLLHIDKPFVSYFDRVDLVDLRRSLIP